MQTCVQIKTEKVRKEKKKNSQGPKVVIERKFKTAGAGNTSSRVVERRARKNKTKIRRRRIIRRNVLAAHERERGIEKCCSALGLRSTRLPCKAIEKRREREDVWCPNPWDDDERIFSGFHFSEHQTPRWSRVGCIAGSSSRFPPCTRYCIYTFGRQEFQWCVALSLTLLSEKNRVTAAIWEVLKNQLRFYLCVKRGARVFFRNFLF